MASVSAPCLSTQPNAELAMLKKEHVHLRANPRRPEGFDVPAGVLKNMFNRDTRSDLMTTILPDIRYSASMFSRKSEGRTTTYVTTGSMSRSLSGGMVTLGLEGTKDLVVSFREGGAGTQEYVGIIAFPTKIDISKATYEYGAGVLRIEVPEKPSTRKSVFFDLIIEEI